MCVCTVDAWDVVESYGQTLEIRDASRKDGTRHGEEHQFRLTFKEIAVALFIIALYADVEVYLKCSECH